nr:hypothetical protein B0A51_08448 [Rachicladosporium sp. CCFEE 5018]
MSKNRPNWTNPQTPLQFPGHGQLAIRPAQQAQQVATPAQRPFGPRVRTRCHCSSTASCNTSTTTTTTTTNLSTQQQVQNQQQVQVQQRPIHPPQPPQLPQAVQQTYHVQQQYVQRLSPPPQLLSQPQVQPQYVKQRRVQEPQVQQQYVQRQQMARPSPVNQHMQVVHQQSVQQQHTQAQQQHMTQQRVQQGRVQQQQTVQKVHGQQQQPPLIQHNHVQQKHIGQPQHAQQHVQQQQYVQVPVKEAPGQLLPPPPPRIKSPPPQVLSRPPPKPRSPPPQVLPRSPPRPQSPPPQVLPKSPKSSAPPPFIQAQSHEGRSQSPPSQTPVAATTSSKAIAANVHPYGIVLCPEGYGWLHSPGGRICQNGRHYITNEEQSATDRGQRHPRILAPTPRQAREAEARYRNVINHEEWAVWVEGDLEGVRESDEVDERHAAILFRVPRCKDGRYGHGFGWVDRLVVCDTCGYAPDRDVPRGGRAGLMRG